MESYDRVGEDMHDKIFNYGESFHLFLLILFPFCSILATQTLTYFQRILSIGCRVMGHGLNFSGH